MSLQPFLDTLQEFKDEIAKLQSGEESIIRKSSISMQLSGKYLMDLLKLVVNHGFQDKKEEIIFFKVIKPQILSVALFYREVILIETAKSINTEKRRKKFLNRKQNEVIRFFNKNKLFYGYYRGKLEICDELLFLGCNKRYFKKRRNSNLIIDIYFSTKCDLLLAKVMAYEKLLEYLNSEIKKIDNEESGRSPSGISHFSWTASKSALVELIYALHGSGAINNGNADIKELAQYLGGLFNIKIEEDVYRIFVEIKRRKKEPASFIDKLKETLLKLISKSFE